MQRDGSELTRTTLAVIVIFGLLLASFWIVRPFLMPLLWATTIVIATWPMMLSVERLLGGRRWLAVAAMTAALLLVLVVPFSLALGAIIANVDEIADWATTATQLRLPPAPAWLGKLPVFGGKTAAAWNELALKAPEELAKELAPHGGDVVRWFVDQMGSFGALSLQFVLTAVAAAILWTGGEGAGTWVLRFARRLAGERGDAVVRLAAQAIRGVALGVVLTALAQSVLGGAGLLLAGVPFAPILTAVMFMMAISQLGAVPVMAASVGWLFWKGDSLWGGALLAWTLVVGMLDNVLRPILIRRGADLPLLLIFAGVIGGLVAFGLVGIFVGPVVLAVTYTLLQAWVSDHEQARAEPEGAAPPAA
jgi:predicted PurR-regulated permease PerM